jgi:serine protease Do
MAIIKWGDRAKIVFMLLVGVWWCLPAIAAVPNNPTLAPMLAKVLPAIVNIKAQIKVSDYAGVSQFEKQGRINNDDSDAQNEKILSLGSGVIVDQFKGYILTNAHVVNDASFIIITLNNGRHFNARVVGLDKPSDVALLQIKAKNLTAIKLGNSSNLQVGDLVAAIGNPFGLNQTVTSGVVSALERTTLGIENYENFIQTDAPINPGNSGGALVDVAGKLVGINTAIIAPSNGSVGIGFAIPVNMAKSVMAQLIKYGDVKRGMLGLVTQDLTPDLADAFHTKAAQGAAVTMVQANSSAQLAGIQVNDIITAIDGYPIKNSSDVVNNIGFLRVNSKVHLTIMRANETHELIATLIDPGKHIEQLAAQDPFLYGLVLQDYTEVSQAHGNASGVLVLNVMQSSNAGQADLHPGDVIIAANQQSITNVAELKKIAATASGTLLLNILRGPGALFLVINQEN